MSKNSQLLASWYDLLKKHGPWFLLLIVAVIFRFTGLKYLPGGLFPDEAANGLDINLIFDGHLQPFYERGNGREALFFYLLAPVVALLGRTPFAHHLVSAGIGVLVVLLTYFLLRRWFAERLAFIAAFLTAVSSWYVTMSRTAFRANLTPLLVLLFFYFATRVAQSKNKKDYWLSAFVAGVSFGLGFYTYISYRMMIPLLGLVLFALLIADFNRSRKWEITKKYSKAIFVGAGGFIVSFAWLGIYFIQNPEWIVGRSGQVSIFSQDLNNGNMVGTFLDVLGKTFMSFLTHGDLNWRHNISGFPFLSFLIAPFFIAGLLYVIVQGILFIIKLFKQKQNKLESNINLKRLPFFILFLWFFFMLAPEILTAEGIPHGLRLVGIIPAVFIIPALFIEEIIARLPHEKRNTDNLRKITVALGLVLFLGAEMIYSANLYFGIAANSPEYAYAYRSDLTTVSDYLNALNNKNKTYLVIDWFSEQTPQYLTTKTNQPYQVVDPGSLWNGPDNVIIGRHENERRGLRLQSGDQVVFTQSTIYDTQAFEKYFPNTQLVYESRNRFGEIIIKVYEQP